MCKEHTTVKYVLKHPEENQSKDLFTSKKKREVSLYFLKKMYLIVSNKRATCTSMFISKQKQEESIYFWKRGICLFPKESNMHLFMYGKARDIYVYFRMQDTRYKIQDILLPNHGPHKSIKSTNMQRYMQG